MQTSPRQIPVWDIWVRFTHWAVALGVLLNLAITEEGSDIHQYVGYAVVALVVSRLIWGFIGSRYARFASFFPTPKRVKTHISHVLNRQLDPQEVGHNPLAALMMFALWGVILGLGVTGYLMGTDAFWGEDWPKEIHEVFANSLYLLIPVHVVSAIIMGRLQKQNLIKSMITGKKNLP